MCPNPCWWHLRCQCWLRGGRSPWGRGRGVLSTGDWEQKEPHWDATKKYEPCPYFQPLLQKKKIAEMFSIQKPGAEFVPSWLQKQPHVGLWPHFIPVTNDKVWNKPCQDVVTSWTSRHPCPEVYNRRNSLLCELIPTSFNDTHSKRG